MSLVIANVPVADFVESAWLVAVTCTVSGDGMSAGAVYTPAGVIVPSVAFPPGTPFTLQLTRCQWYSLPSQQMSPGPRAQPIRSLA